MRGRQRPMGSHSSMTKGWFGSVLSMTTSHRSRARVRPIRRCEAISRIAPQGLIDRETLRDRRVLDRLLRIERAELSL